MTTYATLTGNYLRETESVLAAASAVKHSLGGDAIELEMAIAGLEQAAAGQASEGSQYRAFMFSALETGAEPEAPDPQRARLTDDTLATVLLDMKVANVLLAAGQSTGEGGAQAAPGYLDSALADLNQVVEGARPAFAQPLDATTPPGRLSFAMTPVGAEAAEAPMPAESDAAPSVTSPDLETATVAFTAQVGASLDQIVAAARGVVTAVVDALAKIDPQHIMTALSRLGMQVGELPKVGRLVRKGLEKIGEVIDSLIRLVGSEILAKARDQVKQVWTDIQEGKYVDEVIGWALRVDETRDYATGATGTGATRERLDAATGSLKQLSARFEESMKVGESVVTTITFGATVAALIPGAAAQTALVAATLYTLVLGVAVLTGMDYTDATPLLKRVSGVRAVVDGARST